MDRTIIGSVTAKGGFANEDKICEKFNNWKEDKDAKRWLAIMGYDIAKINSVEAIKIPTRIKETDVSKFGVVEKNFEDLMRFKKADAKLKIIVKIGTVLSVENLSLKKANSDADYNQIDKRLIDAYQRMWGFDYEIAFWLKLFTGENSPKKFSELVDSRFLRDTRRVFLDEMPPHITNKILKFFEENKILIVSDILQGRGAFSANWFLVTKYDKQENTTTWLLKDINIVMNFFGTGKVKISPEGSLYIGKITVQRKGGTPDPTKLQFKIKPCKIFELGE